jgi:Ca-activated chloride channel homolog
MQQNIDQQFHEAIGKLEGNPQGLSRDPEANWAEIASRMDQDRRKRRGAWLWMAAAASVVLLVAVGWMLLPGQDDQSTGMAYGEKFDTVKTYSSLRHRSGTDQDAPEELLKQGTGDLKAMEDVTMQQQKSSERKVVRGGSWKNGSDFITTGTRGALNQGSTVTLSTDQDFWAAPAANGTIAVNPSVTTTYNISTQGGTKPYTYTWNFGDGSEVNGQSQVYTQPGRYTVNVLDANGCVSGKSVIINEELEKNNQPLLGFFNTGKKSTEQLKLNKGGTPAEYGDVQDPYGSESYAETVENAYYRTIQEPLSTFSIDVDRASYTNHRRFIEAGQLPPKYSVRAEEFINYFDYTYAQPRNDVPFFILPEMTTCPWNPNHKLVRIALKGREVATENVPASNLVFLIDVSGSMVDPDKLPLLKKAMTLLTQNLREQDKVSIVVYAGAAGLVLPPTSGSNKQAILGALDKLEAGGSTAGGEGIELAYATAKQNYMRGGNNRVILATDGDFNVGISDETGLENLIVKKREEGVFLSVLGFGEGNLQDSKMELLADKGNGNYNYIDGEKEGQKVLVSEFGGTLYTIAKDVKIQVEFNPTQVESYRLVGYENRKLKNEDFANDKIDAGELGAGHTVTALYEIVPTKEGMTGAAKEQALKYQTSVPSNAAASKEVVTVKLRYKEPDGSVSKLLEKVLLDDGRNIAQTSEDFRWAVAVAEYALILRQSEYKGMASYEQVLSLARSAMGPDKEGLRKEFIDLVTKAASLTVTAKGN